MDSQTIRTALGVLQDNPDDQHNWRALKSAASAPGGDLSPAEFSSWLSAARQQHEARGEWEAVAHLLELELGQAQGKEREAELLATWARVLKDELCEEQAGIDVYQRLSKLRPDDPSIAKLLAEHADRSGRWQALESSYLEEAEKAVDDVYQSSMLMRASEIALRFGGNSLDARTILERLERAVRLDASNAPAATILDRLYRRDGRPEDAARVLERLADRAETPAIRVQAGLRLAHLYAHQLGDQERAVRAYSRVLRDDPTNAEAMSVLSSIFSRGQRWDELVALYEKQLHEADLGNAERLGDMLQIAMLYWRKLERPQDAESWFDRIRKIDATHPGMLDFYREYLGKLGDDARLITVLQAAQRGTKDERERARLGGELARLAEGQQNAQKAIEQYKSLLRHDPDNHEARFALKRLYKQTEGYNALVELLRQQLERTDPKDYNTRIGVLREVADVYRTFIKSDTALVSVLNQIVQLDEQIDEQDVNELRELVELYERLGRWRDLLTYQLKLAEVTPDVEEKKQLYRAAGQRWLDQFTNVQNATEAYEQLLKVAPDDADARQKLEELYRKRRAWPALYDLFLSEVDRVQGDRRIATLKEMAQLAAERLNRGADAVRLYRQILDEDPSRPEVLDALEKHAERARDWATLADALERRVEVLTDDKERLNVLQKLGAVYGEHLNDPVLAARAWRRVLDLQPGHHRALRVLRDAYLQSGDYAGLEELYESQEDFEGLAEVLSNAADRARDPATKIDLSYRAARVYDDKLGQPDRSFRSYERILATDPSDARAASALIPLYEKDEKWARLPALYEVMLGQTKDSTEKFYLLERLVEVTGTRLLDRKAAVAYARKAYHLEPSELGALDLLESACRAAGSWDVFVEAIENRLRDLAPQASSPELGYEPPEDAKKKRKKKRGKEDESPEAVAVTPAAPSADDPERRLLELKLGGVYADELGRVDDAIAAYRRLLQSQPGDEDVSAALETILRREDRRDELRWLLDLRVRHAINDDERVRILGEWATLEEEVFESREQAVVLYRRVLDLAPEDDVALRALPRLLLAAGDPQGAAEVIARDRDRLLGSERAEREVELAELCIDRLERPVEALGAAVRALDLVPYDPRAIRVLERLQQLPEVQAKAATVLAEQYATHGDPRREAHSVGVLLQHARAKNERLALHYRLADIYELNLESYSSALDVILLAATEYPLELDLWDRAETLAVRAGRTTDLAHTFREVLLRELPADILIELSDRAARWHEERLGDPTGAIPYLEKVLGLEPANERAFGRLKDILTGAERWGELEALYDRTSEATPDASRRSTMLVEVALVCEDIIEDPAKATRYYERILEIDPMHEGALEALDRLYTEQKRHRDLAQLLEQRLQTAEGEEIFDYKLRLGRIQLTELHEPERAILHIEDVLNERPNDHTARELAEKTLEIGSLRARAARILESVYDARDEIRDLVRVLGVRLEELDAELAEPGADPAGTRQDERRELLRRIATLRDERLHDDEGAFAALSRLVPEDPLDAVARDRMLEIARRLGAHARVAEVLTQAAERADTPGVQGEILMRVARLYQEQLGDLAKAEATYRRVLGLDEHDAELVLPAARALGKIYAASGQSTRLADMLRVEVRLEQDSAARSELLGRLGELCQRVLGDAAGAIEAWKTRLDDDSQDDRALLALDQLYEQTGAWRELVSVLERRRDVVENPSTRRQLMIRAATVLADKIGKTGSAIDTWRLVVDECGPDAESLGALEQLLRTDERWSELADTYERHLDITQSDSDRLDLLARLGDLRREHQQNIVLALDAYRSALAIDPSHGPSRLALEQLLDATDTSCRREAAEILHPIYLSEQNSERLLRVLEIEVLTTDDLDLQLEGLERAMEVAELSLTDPGRAFGYAERGLRTAVGHVEPKPWLEHVERLAGITGRQAEHVRLLCEVLPGLFEGDTQLEVTLRIAEIARHRLADRDLAREYYRKALDVRPDERSALVALESLYEEAGNAQSLLEILERRVDVAESDEEKKQLLYRRARLLAEVLEDKERAIAVYESILDLQLEDPAVTALEQLYSDQHQFSELIGLYERELEHRRGDPARLHVKIANLAAHRLQDIGRAFEELERALELSRQNQEAIQELERLLREAEDPDHRARAALLLEPVYLARADYDRVMETMGARLDSSRDPTERRELLGRLAHLYEEQKEDYAQALEITARLLHEDIGNHVTITELERLAKVANASHRLAEIYATELGDAPLTDEATARLARRTGELFDQLGEPDRALALLRRALEFEPENEELFHTMDTILERTERHRERVELYRQTLDHRFVTSARLDLLHTIAHLERNALVRPDAAIETYRAALDTDETDLMALDALTELYRERTRWNDLAELYLRRAEGAASVARAANYRLALARLYLEQIDDPERAIDQLEEVVRSNPSQAEAIRELEQLLARAEHKQRVVEILRPLYQEQDDWRHTIKLNEERFGLALELSDRVAVLRETSSLWEKRGRDFPRAWKAMRLAVQLNPDDDEVRGELERLTEATQAYGQLASTYDALLTEHPDLVTRREILAKLAELYDRHLDDPRQALAAYDRLHETEPFELEPLEKMEQLAMLLSDWDTVVRALTARAELLLGDEQRASVWRQVGEAKRDMLDDRAGAVSAYERALELDPMSAFTIDCLIDLYEDRRDARRLVELYQRRVELAEDDDELKYDLLTRAARVYEEQLSDPIKSIEVLGQALGVRTTDRQVLASLNRLYRAERMWPELLDNLKLQAQSAESPEERTRLRKEVGQLLAEKLASYEEALEAYRVVLEETPGDEQAMASVRAIAEQHEQMRAAVADVLVPVLKSARRWADLALVLEMRLSIETDPTQRTQTLRSIADVLESKLQQPAEAEQALLRALSEAPDATDLHEQIERLAALSDGWGRYADALAERGSAVFEPALGKDIYTRLGRVAEQHLADDRRAISAYTRALEMAGDEPMLLEALDRLYAKTRDAAALADILERRAAITADPTEQAELSYRLGVLHIHDFREPGRGLGALRTTLERAPGHQAATLELEKLLGERDFFEEAAEILEGVYRSRSQHTDLARLYAKRVDFAETSVEKSERRRELATVLEQECGDALAAQRVLERGLSDDPTDPIALGELERLASITGDWRSASAALEKALSETPDLGSNTGRELWVRLAGWLRDKAQDSLAAERALTKALDLGPSSDEVLLLLEELQRAPGRQRELVATLRRRAKLQPNDLEREELMRRAKGLADELGDAALAEEILRELTQLDEGNLWALEELTRLREAAGDYGETFTLLVKRSDVQLEGEIVRDLRHRAAAMARDQLGKPNEAIQLYEALFDDRPGDEVAAKALRELYQSTKRWLDLGRLIDRLIDQADTPSLRSALRIELAQLNEHQYGASDTAIALLHAVLDEQPGHGDAVVALSQLLERTERDEELAELLSSQIDAARARADTEAELRFHVRLGQVCESRLKDRSRAIDTYRDVLARDPQHREALQALARLHQGAEDHAEAAMVLEKLLELSQGEEAVQCAGVLANEYGKLGDADAAARALERGLAADERNAGLRSRLRGLYQSRQAWDKLAALVARDADFADSPAAQVLLLREAAGIHSGRRHDHAAAAELLERATALMPGDRELLLQLCDAYSASGRGSAAAEVLEKVVESYGVKRTKELADVHRRLADAYVADGKTSKALEELDKAFRIEPGNVHVLKKLGEVALQAGDAKRAQQMFRALLLQKLEGNAPITKAEVFFNLGEVHYKLGEKDKAKQMYERAIQADADLARAKERLAELKS